MMMMMDSLGHPPEQRMPKENGLLRWYIDLLYRSYLRGFITEVDNVVDEFLQGKFDKTYVQSSQLLL